MSRRRPFGDGRALYPRAALDFYREDAASDAALFAVERFRGAIFDPACGEGTVLAAARAAGYAAAGADIRDRGCGAAVRDFLAAAGRPCDNIVCNPPFAAAEAFAHRALELARRKVALLLRLAFLEGMGRWARLFRARPPARVWVFRARQSMPPGEAPGRRAGGQMAFAWFVWERRGGQSAPAIGWL